MPKIFTTLDKIKPAYDITYKVVLFICKLLLIADILITTMSVIGRYVSFIPDPAWSEEVVLTCMSYMAVLSAALAIRRGAHIRMTAFDVYLPKIAVKVLDISGRSCRVHSGCHHDGGRLELCHHSGRPRLLRVHALAEPLLDVLPGAAGRCCHDHLRDRGTVQPHQEHFCKGGSVI